MNPKAILSTAIIAGLVSGNVALADSHKTPAKKGDAATAHKDGCEGKKMDDKNECKGKKKDAGKKDKNSCGGKDGCGGEEPKAE